MNRPSMELLAPAGDMERLATALAYGADAVYLGGSALNLRAKAKGFSEQELVRAFSLVREQDKRCYFCLNAYPREQHMAGAEQTLAWLASLDTGPQALIIADPGVLRLARRMLPDMDIHLSTQANTANAESLRFWADFGVKRVNLARELSAPEIKALARAGTGLELEVFVHGAMCMALSGRCLLSSYLGDRPANLGSCTHPCRYGYRAVAVALEERTRPGKRLWETVEQDGFSAVYAAEDLCLVSHLGFLARHGIGSVKIEGRTKTASYLAQVVDTYRMALDALALPPESRPPAREYIDRLRNAATRPMGTGFFHRCGPSGPVMLCDPPAQEERIPMVARLGQRLGPDSWLVHVRDRWQPAGTIRLMLPGGRRHLIPAQDYSLEDLDGVRLDMVHSGTDRILRCAHPQLAQDLFLQLLP